VTAQNLIKISCHTGHDALMNRLLAKAIQELGSMPVGVYIQDPEMLIMTGFNLPEHVVRMFGAESSEVCFTKKTLKHVLEKGDEGKRLLAIANELIVNPDMIFETREVGRCLLVNSFRHADNRRPHVAGIEMSKGGRFIIITLFQSDSKYLSNFELLWRTGDLH
jgi:hypothetical protein